jgi:TRAP-type C4-dicarboxylate transport system permease small subunit
MRRVLATLYLGCGLLAAAFLAAIAVFILIAIAGSLFGFITRSMDEFAGYAMAASAFLGLAYTFGTDEHIRVTLVLQRLRGPLRRALEVWCHGIGALLAAYFAWYSVKMTLVSWQLNDVSQGLVPVPLWIPQLGMAVGTTVFALAVVERLVGLIGGGELPADAGADARADR